MCTFDLIECGREISVWNTPMRLLLSKSWRHARLETRFSALNPMPDGTFRKVVIKKDFRTDFASVPRPLWWFAPPLGRYVAAAVLHDDLYNRGEEYGTRYEADYGFYRNMLKLGVKKWRAWLMFKAVRVAGWLSFNGEDKEKTHVNGMKP